MKKYRITLEVEIDGEYPLDEVEEYLQYEFGYNSCCRADNPLFFEGDCQTTDFEMDEI